MKTNHAGRQLIMDAETLKLEAYRCPVGKWTIGWGHTGDVKPGMKINLHQAEVIFEHDLDVHEQVVTEAVKVPLNSNQFSALVSLVFNIGPGKADVQDGFVTLKNGNPSSIL